jgi:uncharacterized membrane protein
MTSGSGSGRGSNAELVAAIAYLGGAISGIAVLIAEKHDRFVRFHAMQSTVTFLAVLVAHLLLRSVPLIGGLLYVPFLVGVAVLWVYLMFQAISGKTFKLPYIGDFAEQRLR